MCGIIGYVGEKNNVMYLIDKLKKLEYRGYDSSGLSILENKNIKTIKAVGNISNLEKEVGENLKSTCLIAHTRWATHGKATVKNAHPHISKNKTWSVVHNGIIENYLNIKKNLKNEIDSDTDTAVIPELLEEKNVTSIEEFIECIEMLKGSYGIVAMSENSDDCLYLAKNKNPMYVALDDKDNILVASDPICFVNFSKSYYIICDHEYALASKGKITFYNKDKEIIEKDLMKLGEEFEESSKKDYEHYMIKEIEEQPKVLMKIANVYKDVLNKYSVSFIKKFNSVKLIGCGTAYHASMIGAKYFEKILKLKATAEIASEFAYNNPLVDEKTLYIFISQSGETADTIKALELVKGKGATTLSFTNVIYSMIARISDYVLPVCAGPEIAVASTKAYVCQIAALYLFVNHLAGKDSIKEIEELSSSINTQDYGKIEKMADEIKKSKDIIFIGKDFDSVTASEGALKLKETSYINATSYPSGELKHGFLALVEEGTPIISIMTNHDINLKTKNAASEAVSRGAKEYIITSDELNGDNVIRVKAPNTYLMPIAAVIPLQILAYKVSCKKGINPDQPRNLAKSVTVE